MPDNLPPLPEGTRYGGLLRDHTGRLAGFIYNPEDPDGWEYSGYWYGMATDPQADTADWHVALPIEAARDQPAVGTLFVPCQHCRNSPICAQLGHCEIHGATGVEARVCGWQPIETAPKDKTIILAADYSGRVTEGYWDEPNHGAYLGDCGGGCCCPEYDEPPEPYWNSSDGGFTKEHPPTHWMPLPDPPKIVEILLPIPLSPI